MSEVGSTYIFMDLGTTGDIKDLASVKITELCMVAVRRDRLLGPCHSLTKDTPAVPRVQRKLTLCFNPGEQLSYKARPGGGFTDDDLQYESTFDESFHLIDSFLNILPEPLYLVAHNGFYFDFPILKNNLKGKSFTKDIMCVDTYFAFYGILKKETGVTSKGEDILAQSLNRLSLDESQASLDVTPKKKIDDIRQANAERVKSPPWGAWKNKPEVEGQYKLTTVYETVFGREPEDAHKADIDCELMLRIATEKSEEFVEWADKNHSSFEKHVELPKSKKAKSVASNIKMVGNTKAAFSGEKAEKKMSPRGNPTASSKSGERTLQSGLLKTRTKMK